MRFTIKREELLKGLNIAGRAISSKAAIPLLKNFKLELDEKGLCITGSDYNISIRTIVPYSIGDQEIIRNYKEGAVLISARFISEITRKLESDEITFDVIDSTIVTISDSDNHSQFTLDCIRPEEYPDLDLEAIGTSITLTRNDFSLLVSQTAFAASLKEQRPILTAMNLEANNGTLTATATDSARMARKSITVPFDVDFISNVPARMMVEVDHLIENENSVEISFSSSSSFGSLEGISSSSTFLSSNSSNICFASSKFLE